MTLIIPPNDFAKNTHRPITTDALNTILSSDYPDVNKYIEILKDGAETENPSHGEMGTSYISTFYL
ncbi:MAG: hypothetical protein Q7K21_03535 [Elusimicrobiota bacterium]|nr:hypothetical protein [Elusimicrobiota bacterium]